MNRIKKRHIFLVTLLAALLVAAIFYLKNDSEKNGAFIRPFDQERDFLPLIAIMNSNTFWVSERPNFSPEKVLLWRAPQDQPEKKGMASIDVIETDGKAAGFITYYKKSPVHGYVWILAVGNDFRGRGFGQKLMEHALKSLKKSGSNYVTLGTRLINKPALALYKKLGFVELSRIEEQGTVTLIKRDL